MFVKLFKNEDGATAIEYGLIAALIAVAAISAMSFLGNEVTSTFGVSGSEVKAGRERGTATYTPPAASN